MKKRIMLFVLISQVILTANAQYQLPKLNYGYADLKPFIDEMTMNMHYNKHHAAYVNNVNIFFVKNPSYRGTKIEDLISKINTLPADDQMLVRNNGGGHYNHSLFWSLLSPEAKSVEEGPVIDAIIEQFDSLNKFKDQFTKAAVGRFGSGWAWLVVDNEGKLQIGSTPNQDSPIMDVSIFKGKPILALDVWEHAYYLTYKSARADYVQAFWYIINWGEVNRLYQEAIK
jgi:Fe-Mn family superoxide dismutase